MRHLFAVWYAPDEKLWHAYSVHHDCSAMASLILGAVDNLRNNLLLELAFLRNGSRPKTTKQIAQHYRRSRRNDDQLEFFSKKLEYALPVPCHGDDVDPNKTYYGYLDVHEGQFKTIPQCFRTNARRKRTQRRTR